MKILVISAHPDDETLGCGGTLLRHKAQGDRIDWIIATKAHTPQWPARLVAKKNREIDRAAKAYGMKRVYKLGFPAAGLAAVPENQLIQEILGALRQSTPEIVYLVHAGDVHSDHRSLFAAALAAMKGFRMRSLGVRRILSYETLSSTEAAAPVLGNVFLPTVFVDISPFIERKIDVWSLYATELQAAPGPRDASAIRALARYRGASIGVSAAEAFVLIREVV